MINVSIVILNWNRFEETIECIRSVKKLDRRGIKLCTIVVDNGSSDSSVEKLRKLKKIHDYKLLENKDNRGYAGGNNVGIKYALNVNSEYILILNNDTVVDKNLLFYLIKSIESGINVGIITPKIYFHKGYEFHKDKYEFRELGKVLWYAGGKMDWNNVFGVNRGVDEIDTGQYDREGEVDFATGTCMFVRAEVLRTVGYFDEKYFMYFEDADLSQRFIKKGFKILYQPNALLWHKVARSSKIGSNLNDYFITRNRLLFGMRYAPFRSRLALYRESLRFLLNGRDWQKRGVIDYYFSKFEKGSWKDETR